ncbi:MAG: NAD(P)/FAD-dependent oxidoreductase [Betaproteobacteria bacterium]
MSGGTAQGTVRATVAIVGAGPAGLRAAAALVEAGLHPVLIDEAPRVGGQAYRQPPTCRPRPLKALYGFEAGKASALFERFAALQGRIDHLPDTLVWQIEDRTLHLLQDGRARSLSVDALILATGAAERVLPFPGWTLPGVFTLGAAQVALKAQATLLGPRIVLAGSGPLLYLVAWQYLKAGAQVLAVLDAAPCDAPRRALPGLLARPAMAAKGAWYLAQLILAGVPVKRGVSGLRAEGTDRLQRLHWQQAGPEQSLDCDAVAFSQGLRSETQLADLAGCAFDWNALDQAWLPRQDAAGRSSVPGVYLAGDGAGIGGADAAELAGERAALALLQDLGLAAGSARADALERALQPHRRFRQAIEVLSPPPADWAAQVDDGLVVCRCEEVTAGELRACARDTGTREINRLKALTRIGMGRCQGRMCAAAAAQLLAQACGCTLQEVGRLRSQPPVKPVPVAVLGASLAQARPVPKAQRDD